MSDECPICQTVLTVDARLVMKADNILVGGRPMTTNGGQRVWSCPTHGIMRVANCLTDLYMAHAYPDMKLEKGVWVPR